MLGNWTIIYIQMGNSSQLRIKGGRRDEKSLGYPLAGFGEGSVTGKSRGDIVSAREKTGAQLLNKALSIYTPKKARPVMAWKQRDNISSSWLLALPGGDSTLSNCRQKLIRSRKLFCSSW